MLPRIFIWRTSLVEIELLQIIAQRALADPERFRRRFLDALGFFERPVNGLFFDPFYVVVELCRWQPPWLRDAGVEKGDRLEPNHQPPGEHDGSLDGVLELPDIAGPVIGTQQGERVVRDALDVLAGSPTVFVDKVLDEDRECLRAVREAAGSRWG